MSKLIKIFFALFVTLGLRLQAQDQGTTPAPDGAQKTQSGPLTKKQQYIQNRKEWKAKRKAEMEERKRIKQHHKKIQSKETRKMMKRTKRKSQLNHDNKKEIFFIRWFRKK